MNSRTRIIGGTLVWLALLAGTTSSPAVVTSSCNGLAPAVGASCVHFLAGPSLTIIASAPQTTFMEVLIIETVTGATLLRCAATGTSCHATTFVHLSPSGATLPTGVPLTCRALGASVTYSFACYSFT